MESGRTAGSLSRVLTVQVRSNSVQDAGRGFANSGTQILKKLEKQFCSSTLCTVITVWLRHGVTS